MQRPKGEIPDSAMILKAMALFAFPGQTVDATAAGDECMEVQPASKEGAPLSPNLWAPMLKSSQSSHDGWLWMLQQVDFGFAGIPLQFPPPLFDLSAFTLEPPKDPIKPEPDWYPTGSILQRAVPKKLGGPGLKVPNVVMLNPLAGFPYCLSCHSTARSQSTFASMDNILGKELRYKVFDGSAAAPAQPPAPADVFSPFPKPLSEPPQSFLTFFNQLAPVGFAAAWRNRMPAESYEQQVVSAHGGPGQFLIAAQCNACHNATPQSPLLPNMIFVEEQAERASPLRNLSPYGERRVSPMGLAGRDPVFFSQLQGETNRLSQLTTCIENTCLHCHAVMGQRQLAIDTKGSGDDTCRNMFAIAPPPEVPFGKPLRRSAMQQWPGSAQTDLQLYGALGRDEVSCAVCHHIAKTSLGEERSSTGNFVTGKPDEIYGPYKSDTVVTKPMEHALGSTPQFGEQITRSEMCGSCHDILLPIFDNSGHRLGASYEQSTHLEWQNSDYGRHGRRFQSCQDCHMPRSSLINGRAAWMSLRA